MSAASKKKKQKQNKSLVLIQKIIHCSNINDVEKRKLEIIESEENQNFFICSVIDELNADEEAKVYIKDCKLSPGYYTVFTVPLRNLTAN